MSSIGCEFYLVVELTIDYDVDIIAEMVGLTVASYLKPARMWNCRENGQAFDDLADIAFMFGGEQDDVTDHWMAVSCCGTARIAIFRLWLPQC
ncbi:hypothetical protein ABIE89_000355 [Bradyrhizobium niftali]